MANDPQPPARTGLAHQFPSFFSGGEAVPAGYYQPVPAIYPDQILGRPAVAHQLPFLFKPGKLVTPPAAQPIQPIAPSFLPGRPARAHEYQFIAKPGKFVTPVAPAIPGVGAVGPMLALSLEPGTKVIYSWSTSVMPSYDGSEQRESLRDQPRRRFEGAAFLLDGQDRDAKGALVRVAATGAPFLLALPFEELTISADSTATTVNVSSTARCDWARAGQRAVVVARDPAIAPVSVIVQSSTATTISIVAVNAAGNFTFSNLGSAGLAGGRIMPLVQVLLDSTQGFARYPVTVDLWSLRADASVFGWAGVDAMGVGTTIATISDPEPIPIANLVEADIVVWDRQNALDGTASESMTSRTEVVDLGGVPFAIGGATVPDWSRSVRLRSASIDDFAWLKALLRFVHGRQVPFLLSTNRDDLVYVSSASGGIKVASSSVPGGGDYASWFASDAHQRLAITAGGDVQYVGVTAVADNGDGTLTLTLDNSPSGTVTKVSFLELVRFARDEIEVAWDGATFAFDEAVVTVQETITVPFRLLFDAFIDATNLTFPTTPPKQFAGVMGEITLVSYSSDRTLSIGSIHNTASGGNVDGAVVCFCNLNSSSFGMTLVHEDTVSAAADRFLNAGLADVVGSRNAVWYRYNAALLRWVQFWST